MVDDKAKVGPVELRNSLARFRSAVSSRSRAYRSGNSALASGDLATAESRVAYAVDGADAKPEWIQRLGFVRERRKKYESALTTYHQAIGLDSTRAEWFYRAGVCARHLGRQSEANELFEYAVQRSNSHTRAADALAASIPTELPGWRRMQLLELALSASHKEEILRDAARLAYSMKRYETTIEYVETIETIADATVDDLILLGSALASRHEHDRSYEVLVRAAERSDDRKSRVVGPGALLDQRGEWENAFAIHEIEWMKSGDTNHHAAFGAAYALDRQYYWELSLPWYHHALSAESNHPAYWAYKYAHALERVENWNDAVKWYSRALDLGGLKQWDWFYRLGYCLYRSEHYEAAAVALRRWLLQTVQIEAPGKSLKDVTKEARTDDLNNHFGGDVETSVGTTRSERFDQELWTRSSAIANEIDISQSGIKNVSKKSTAQARKAREAGDFETADAKYRQAYLASGKADLQVIDEWSGSLISREKYMVASKLLLDHREFFRPDGIHLKKMVGSNFERRKARYAEYCSRFELDGETILFESYWGTRINDSPKAIYAELLLDDRFKDHLFYWTWDGKTEVPGDLSDDGRTILVEYGSADYDRVLATAGVVINNTSFVQYYSRRPGQQYLNTWHGTPLKTLGKKIGTGVLEHSNVSRNLLQVTDLLLPNEYTAEKLCADYDVETLASGHVSVVGSPRLDSLVRNLSGTSDQILNKIGLDAASTVGKRIVFYAPTWRGSATEKGEDSDLVARTLFILNEVDDLIVLYRPHHMVDDGSAEIPDGVLVLDSTIDTYDLLQVTDILVTDYSSLLFDFLSTDRRVICYVPDIESYRAERGLYIEPCDVITEVAYTESDLCELLASNKQATDRKYLESKRLYAAHEDGFASRRAIEIILGRTDTNQDAESQPRNKKSVVMFESMIPNGIRSSFQNLCSLLDPEEFAITVAVDVVSIEHDESRRKGLENLPDTVGVLGRVGSMLMTLEERYAISEFSRNFGVVSPSLELLVNSAYKREFCRIFGHPRDTAFVDFEGYSRFWNALLSRGVPDECSSGVILHNQMGQEASVRFPYLYEIGRNYSYFDGIASVANAIDAGNTDFIEKLRQVPVGRLSVVHNSLDDKAIKKAADEAEPLWPVGSEERLKIVSVGRLSPEKNQMLLIESMRELLKHRPNALLKVLGDGPSRSSLESTVRSMGLSESIEFCGFVENPMPTVANADVFALSSLHEGQPMVLFEAMSLGVPVVSTPVPGCVEAVNMGNGRIVGHDPLDFSSALLAEASSNNRTGFDVTEYNKLALTEFSRFIDGLDFNGAAGRGCYCESI